MFLMHSQANCMKFICFNLSHSVINKSTIMYNFFDFEIHAYAYDSHVLFM